MTSARDARHPLENNDSSASILFDISQEASVHGRPQVRLSHSLRPEGHPRLKVPIFFNDKAQMVNSVKGCRRIIPPPAGSRLRAIITGPARSACARDAARWLNHLFRFGPLGVTDTITFLPIWPWLPRSAIKASADRGMPNHRTARYLPRQRSVNIAGQCRYQYAARGRDSGKVSHAGKLRHQPAPSFNV